jgi:phage/plasmid-associated DNA primase
MYGSENHLARKLVKVLGGRENAVFDRGEFRRWDEEGHGWTLVPPEDVNRAATAFEGKYRVVWKDSIRKVIPIKVSRSSAKGIVHLAGVHLARPGFFDKATRGAPFINCLVFIRDNEAVLETHRKEHRTMTEHLLETPFLSFGEASTDAEPFLAFLRDMWCGKPDVEERIAYLLSYIGLALLRETWKYKANPIFLGPANTGKSVALKVIEGLFPEGTVASVPMDAMADRFGLAPLMSAYVNVVTEMSGSALKASEKAKALLVGDRVAVEKKYGNPTSFRCLCGHFFSTNTRPHFDDLALAKRFVLLDCDNVVPYEAQDSTLTKRLLQIRGAIASLAVQSAVRQVVRKGGLAIPPSALVHRAQNVGAMGAAATWTDEMLAHGEDGDFISTDDLYQRFRVADESHNLSKNRFGRQLRLAGFAQKHRGQKGGRGWVARWATPVP